MKELNQKELNFVNEYVKDGNGKEAAIRAGYSARSAKNIACEMLKKQHIIDALDERRHDAQIVTLITVEYVLQNLKEVVEIGMARKAACDGTQKLDLGNANKALDSIGRHLKMFTDKKEIKVTDSITEWLLAEDKETDDESSSI